MPKGGEITRSEIDAYTQFVAIYGAKGLAYIKVNDVAKGREGLQSPIVKNLSDAALKAVIERTGATDGDLIFFGADKAKVVNEALGALRAKIGHERGFAEGALEAAVGGGFPDVRTRRGRQSLASPASPLHRPGGRPRGIAGERSRQGACPRPTIWC